MTDVSDRRIGRRVAALRKERGWSQSYLASLLGVDQSALSRIESGKRRTSAAELDLIATALSVEPGALLEQGDVVLGGSGFSAVDEDIRASVRTAAPFAGDEYAEDASYAPGAERAPGDGEAGLFAPRARPAARDDARETALMASLSPDAIATPRAASFSRIGEFPQRRQRSRASVPPTAAGSSLPAPVAAVIADYLRLRAMAEHAPPRDASWSSVDALGRRRRAGKPTGWTSGRPAAAVSWREPRDRYARLWRHELGIGVDGPVPDLVALFEDAGVAEVIVARLETDEPVCANKTLPSTFGDSPDEVSFLFVNADRPVTLQRHALVHAFGHLALGHGDVVDRRIEWSRATPLEQEANDFAEEFLAPTAAVARWYDRHGDPRPSVDVLLELAAAFGITFWAAYYRSRAAARLGEKPQARLMHELRARQWELLPEQSFRGGLRDTLSTLSEESPLPAPGAVGVGGVRPDLAREPAPLPAVLRVPSRLRLGTLQALRGGRLSLEQAAAVLRRSPADLAVDLERLGLE